MSYGTCESAGEKAIGLDQDKKRAFWLTVYDAILAGGQTRPKLCIGQIEAPISPPPPGTPRAFDTFAVPGGGNLIIRLGESSRGVGNSMPMRRGWGI